MNGATDAFVRFKIGEPVEARGEAVTGSFVEAADAGRKERPVCGCVKALAVSARSRMERGALRFEGNRNSIP